MRKPKNYGATVMLYQSWVNKLEEYSGIKLQHKQYRVVCKATSMAEASRKCASVFGIPKLFTSGNCCETKNVVECNLLDKEGVDIIIYAGAMSFSTTDIKNWFLINSVQYGYVPKGK